MKSLKRIEKIEENTLFGKTEIENFENAFILNYANPLISISLLDKLSDGLVEELKSRAQMEKTLTEEEILTEATNQIYESSKKALKADDNLGLSIANLGKSVIEKKVIPLINQKEVNMSVDDLMSKLYGDKEERGSKSL